MLATVLKGTVAEQQIEKNRKKNAANYLMNAGCGVVRY